MAITCARVVRAFSSTCAPMTTIVGFSLLLTWIFILYKPNSGPGSIQKLGWQSWEVVSLSNDSQSPIQGNNTDLEVPIDPETPDVDWWNVTLPEPQVDSSSFPLDVWAPLLPHTTGRMLIPSFLYYLYSEARSCLQFPKLLSPSVE